MIDPTISIIAITTVVVGNVVGWVYTIIRSSKNESKRQGKYEERLNSLVKDMEELPCKSNPQFQIDMGAMIQKVNDIDRRLGRIEEKLFDGD